MELLRTGVLAAAVLLAALPRAAGRPQEPGAGDADAAPARSAPPRGQERTFGPAPVSPDGPLSEELRQAVDTITGPVLHTGAWGDAERLAVERIGASKDPRLAWILADLMRFTPGRERMRELTAATTVLTGLALDPRNPWKRTVDHLMGWDVPAPPGYLAAKKRIHVAFVPGWERLFVDGDVDWRLVGWGGVGIDDRPYGETDRPCNCIPAADEPAVTDAAGAGWLSDDAVVFGVVVGGAARAYPRRIMEVREMVNDTLGGRSLGIPYCTLCGSAQAFFTDRMPDGVERPVLRTSGLLSRSNKVMFDLRTYSLFDTFRGVAVTGPLRERGVVLQETGVVTTTWGAWRAAHPGTTVLAESLALGRDFDFRHGRDANGPIFPIGAVDPRLPLQEDVLGVVTGAGHAVAFDDASARAALARGERVAFEDVHLVLDGGGLRAVDEEGRDRGGHLAFWFAWSQFHPGTALWPAR